MLSEHPTFRIKAIVLPHLTYSNGICFQKSTNKKWRLLNNLITSHYRHCKVQKKTLFYILKGCIAPAFQLKQA